MGKAKDIWRGLFSKILSSSIINNNYFVLSKINYELLEFFLPIAYNVLAF